MLYGMIYLWYGMTAVSVLYLLWDQFTNTPSLRVMTLAWFLVILYTGPIGLFFYLISCKQPLPNTHDAFIKAHWKQALGSEIHCVAGDATGIIVAALFLSLGSIPNGWETIIEYVVAYLFGLFVFQALFMLSMFSNYFEAVKKTLFSETVSMNFVMLGMLPLVVILRHVWPEGKDPGSPIFWWIMSIATLGGFIIGYPINWWLVKRGEKHGMMSKGMDMHHHDHAHHHGHYHHNEMAMDHHSISKGISTSSKWLWVIGSYALLVAVFYLISLGIPFRF